MTSRLPRRTARALDRLAFHAHAFHRFAHHPLCGRYAHEVIALGRRTRVCRGCVFAGSGALLGAACALLIRPGLELLAASACVGLALGGWSLARRLPKLVGRGLAVASGAFACVGGLVTAGLGARLFAGALLALAGLVLWAYRRRGPNRSPCESCPERGLARPCSGFQPMIQRERAFQRVAQRQIDAALSNLH